MMLIERQAFCPFCGQSVFVQTTNADATEDDLAAMAAEKCECAEAKMHRGMERTEQAIEAILGEDSISRGFDYAFTEDSIEGIRQICKCILYDLMDAVTLKDPFGDSVKLMKDGNSVKIRRTARKQLEM